MNKINISPRNSSIFQQNIIYLLHHKENETIFIL